VLVFASEDLLSLSLSDLRILMENQCFVYPTADFGYTTPYTRFKSVWFIVAPVARSERSDLGFTFDPDGQAINVPDANNVFQPIPFSKLSSLAMDAISCFTNTIQTFLPSRGPNPKLYEKFASHHLTDDLNQQQAVFQQPENKSWLDGLVEQAVQGSKVLLLKNEQKRALLCREKDILQALATAFLLTCGIPPRPSQVKTLRYDWDEKTGSPRNLFIVFGLVALGNPEAKQLGQTTRECLWALPLSLGTPVMFYLGVIRPVLIRVLSCLKGEISQYSMSIFVHPFPVKNSLLWDGAMVNSALQKHMPTLPIKFTGTLLRSATTAMLRRHFPSLTNADLSPDSLLDLQSQHRRRTGDTHYGRDFDIPRSLAMTIDRARGYIAVSQAIQKLYGLGEPNESSRLILSSSHLLASGRHEDIALMEARFQVSSVYLHLAGDGQQLSVQALVGNVLRTAPYIAADDVSALPCISLFTHSSLF